MECKWCKSKKTIRWGTRKNKQLWHCKSCGRYFTYGPKKEKQEYPIIFGYSLGYVIGVLVGDGSLSKWKDYHYFNKGKQVPKAEATKIVPRFRYGFQLAVKDQDFVDAFAKHLQVVTNRKPCTYPITQKSKTTKNLVPIPYTFHGFKAQLISKEWYHKLKPLTDDLSWIKKSNVEVKRGFLRGFFDSEGGYGSWGAVTLTNKNLGLLDLTKSLLHELSISSVVYAKRKMPRLRIPKKNATNFLETVGFSIERKNKKIGEFGC